MKIAQVCPRYYPDIGGIETQVKEISERLATRNFEISVFTTDPSGKLPPEEIISSVAVTRFKSWAPNEAYYVSRELKRDLLANSNNFDVVHAHNYHAFPALYAAQSKGSNSFVFTPHYHGTGHTLFRSLLHLPYRFVGKRIFEKADKIICVSRYEKNLVRRTFGINEEKVAVISNGVDLEEFRALRKTRKDCRKILSVGRLEKYKGVQHLIRVLPRLDKDITLEIVGKGPYKDSLEKLAGKLDVGDRVRFFQDLPRTKLVEKYVNADVFVMLSEHESYGISVAEALCAGTVCVVGRTSALKELIDEENCFGVDSPIDLDELAHIINHVIAKGVRELKILDWDEVTERIADLYRSCMQ